MDTILITINNIPLIQILEHFKNSTGKYWKTEKNLKGTLACGKVLNFTALKIISIPYTMILITNTMRKYLLHKLSMH